jgi:TPR repeat protein
MKKNYIKMNDNHYLSLGNFIKIVKEVSSNSNASQIEIFSSIFGINDINATTVNNYCIGIRAIGLEYKKIFNDIYDENGMDLIKIVLSIMSILDNKVYVFNENSINLINSNKSIDKVINKLMDISSNDENVNKQFINNLNDKDNYNKFVYLLKYAIIENKQPIYTQDINIKINKNELDDYLKIKLYYGQSYISSLIYLAKKNNMYACAELGSLEYDGLVSGRVNYKLSFDYYMSAAKKEHPKACWMVANMILNERVEYDFDVMWEYLNKSIFLGSAAGYNTLGLCYLRGITPSKEVDIKKAQHYFELASDMGYVFAFNNLGKLYEKDDINEAIKYYKIAADMGESWALNKVGEYYRKNGNISLAYVYYSKAIECPLSERNKYAYYNLAKYYYENGCNELNISKDEKKTKEYYKLFEIL